MIFKTFSDEATCDGAVVRTTVVRFSQYNGELPNIFELLYLKLVPRNKHGKYAIAVFNSFNKRIGYIPTQFEISQAELLVNSFKNNLPIAVSVVGIACVPLEVTIELVFHKSAGSIKKHYKRPFYFIRKKRISNQLSLF